ncbi:related to extracellular elastinolytic metalloproteinase precursor [Serendipita indica DSM 11827]|uniref:Extracellular metalloproteinase n=1 Tax=Serendipita indica (strain DSM 11827) TaxID=1109443 RepID=G4TJP7_SERID|nr:related to extracellular elastinolytic metalloproteinase precursor [Serendipita indica DSM 11827]
MRSALLLTSFAASALALQATPLARRSLSFGPVLPQARFILDPPSASLAASATAGPRALAIQFVNELTAQYAGEGHSYYIREDSYTDPRTGVSHFYVRQLVQGIEVADGNINLNIRDGKVISFDADQCASRFPQFYRGEAPPVGISPNTGLSASQEGYCRELRAQFLQPMRAGGGQTTLNNNAHLQRIMNIHDSNCLVPSEHLARIGNPKDDYSDPARAALTFMLHATTDQQLASDIANNFEQRLAGAQRPVRAHLAYVQAPMEDGTTELALVWKLEVELQDNFYEAAVRVSDPSVIVQVVDWVSDVGVDSHRLGRPGGTYNVWKWGINDPDCGERSVEESPYDSVASPLGWHSMPASKDAKSYNKRFAKDTILNITKTYGNNVYAHEDWAGRNDWMDNYRPDGGKDLVFDFPYELKTDNGTWADPKSYIDLTITQLFYTTNMIHDLYYRYGFDEISGNFQQYNFEKGGKEGDAVIANAQDGSGYNNANMMTPPDGTNGRMRMYTWNVHGYPYRDGDLEAGIVIHEYSHGLSTRLTGGPADSSCLGWGESGGMGEGWGDFLATTIRSVKKYHDYPMGSWAANETNGIRNYPYSTNSTINPSTYKTLDKSGYFGVHAIGEVWAEILFVVEHAMVKKHGFSKTLFPPIPDATGKYPEDNDFFRPITYDAKTNKPTSPPIPKHGNSLMVQLVFDGMKLQPCRPGFIEARNAIIQADEILTGGENHCLLWKAFASRGLGKDASVVGRTPWGGGVRRDGFQVPTKCEE